MGNLPDMRFSGTMVPPQTTLIQFLSIVKDCMKGSLLGAGQMMKFLWNTLDFLKAENLSA
jgi:hypothetical protein